MSIMEQVNLLQDFYLFSLRSVLGLLRRPFYLDDVLEQMDYAGAGSLLIILVVADRHMNPGSPP